MVNQKEIRKETERGNALFLILIAVALFAALSYAITQSGRGSGTVNKETNIVVSGQVVEEPAAVRTAVTRMIITGTSASSITFGTGSGATEVFDVNGGGATNVAPPSSACNTACAAWTYLPVTGGTNSGWYVDGLGTNATDALAYLGNISQSVCTQILKGLGMSTTIVHQKTTDFNPAVAGAYTAAGVADNIGDTGATLSGVAFGCYDITAAGTGSYSYYHALIEQ